jgi:hypothetical protein
MKALHFLKWPLILLLAGYLIFLIGNFSKKDHWSLSEIFVSAGYAMIGIAIVWMIIKFILLKAPEDESN